MTSPDPDRPPEVLDDYAPVTAGFVRWRQHAAMLAAMIGTTLVVMLAWAALEVSARR